MSLLRRGKTTLKCEITNITDLGFWLMIMGKEYFVPFSNYPELKQARVNNLFKVKLISPTQLHWKELDYDIEVKALENPRQYPLHFRK